MHKMRKHIAAGNWKMNTDLHSGTQLAKDLLDQLPAPSDTVVILSVPATHLYAVAELVKERPDVHVAAQNFHQEAKGAYTGEVSAGMIKAVGATHVLIGHSERREYFKEDNALLAKKVDAALAAGLVPIFCCGEALAVREAGNQNDYVVDQLQESLYHLSTEEFGRLILAYEPIWAIGTGKTASPEQAQEMHAHLRSALAKKFGQTAADDCSILYGGSVKPTNAKEIFGQPDVDGGLVGGASLKADSFAAIVGSF